MASDPPMALPILYSFRRCPYAIRARLALQVAGIEVEHREVLLRNKPAAMLAASAKGTVPVLVHPDGTVMDESLDIARWALQQHDPDGWLNVDPEAFGALNAQVEQGTGEFKTSLDQYKYFTRHLDHGQVVYRGHCVPFLETLEALLGQHAQLLGDAMTLADAMIFPFVRQFRGVDITWFEESPYPRVRAWLMGHLESALFRTVMVKVPEWQPPA